MKKSRIKPPLLAATLGCAIAWLAPSAGSAATNLDPFAHVRTKSILPFHTAQAEAAPDSLPLPPKESPKAKPEAKSETETKAEARPEAEEPKSAAPVGGQKSCSRDDQCPANTICESGTCRTFERPVDILLYRKDGRSTAFIPFYFSNRGNPGHRVVAPLYFHFWSPESHTQIVAPFYWRVEDHLKQRVVLVIPPYSQTTQPDARSWAVWPFVYVSTKFGWAAPLLGSFSIGDPDKGRSFGLLGFFSGTGSSASGLIGWGVKISLTCSTKVRGVGAGLIGSGVGVGGGATSGLVIGCAGGGGCAAFEPLIDSVGIKRSGINSSTCVSSTFGFGAMKPEHNNSTTSSRCVPAVTMRHFFCSRVIEASGRCATSSA